MPLRPCPRWDRLRRHRRRQAVSPRGFGLVACFAAPIGSRRRTPQPVRRWEFWAAWSVAAARRELPVVRLPVAASPAALPEGARVPLPIRYVSRATPRTSNLWPILMRLPAPGARCHIRCALCALNDCPIGLDARGGPGVALLPGEPVFRGFWPPGGRRIIHIVVATAVVQLAASTV